MYSKIGPLCRVSIFYRSGKLDGKQYIKVGSMLTCQMDSVLKLKIPEM